jgi:hypothetical protein
MWEISFPMLYPASRCLILSCPYRCPMWMCTHFADCMFLPLKSLLTQEVLNPNSNVDVLIMKNCGVWSHSLMRCRIHAIWMHIMSWILVWFDPKLWHFPIDTHYIKHCELSWTDRPIVSMDDQVCLYAVLVWEMLRQWILSNSRQYCVQTQRPQWWLFLTCII